jgi:hypothetical protein
LRPGSRDARDVVLHDATAERATLVTRGDCSPADSPRHGGIDVAP